MHDEVENMQGATLDQGRNARIREAQIASEKARYAGAVFPVRGDYGDEKSAHEPLRYRVESRLRRVSNDAEGLLRIQAIIAEHPEFEQMIELQNLINRHGL